MTLDEVRWILTGTRKARGWSQIALGHQLTIAENTMRMWELGLSSPRVADIEHWASSLGYEVRYELVRKGRSHE